MTKGGPLFHVVMHEPEIPNNTGNIGRTCLAAGCALHLIHPLGFDTSEKALRRAGLDYWPRVDVRHHESWEDYLNGSEERRGAGESDEPRLWLTSGKIGVPPWEVQIKRGDHLIFGKETRGLPSELLDRHEGRVVRFPMAPGERGLNVATAVCALVYEGMRQCAARGEIDIRQDGRIVSRRS